MIAPTPHRRPTLLGTHMLHVHYLVHNAFLGIAAFTLAAAGLVFAPQAAAQAASGSFSVGQRLSREQVQALGKLQQVEIDGRPFQVLSTGTAANGLPLTTLINRSGVIGQTYHELVIANQPTANVRQRAAAALTGAQVKYYDQTDITIARFPALAQAITALTRTRAALPEAKVGLPITFEKPRLR